MNANNARQVTTTVFGGAMWRVELGEMSRLAAPIVLTQLAWVSLLATDTAMIGRLGANAWPARR